MQESLNNAHLWKSASFCPGQETQIPYSLSANRHHKISTFQKYSKLSLWLILPQYPSNPQNTTATGTEDGEECTSNSLLL